MNFEIIRMSWAKRRKYHGFREVSTLVVDDFKEEIFHSTKMHVTFTDGEHVTLNGQVGYNDILEHWTVNGIDGNGNQVAVKVV